MTVTPKMAKSWMDSNTNNRTLRPSHVAYLAKEMSLGHWQLTHQGIAFDDKGILRDGQHRLQAIIDSGKTISLPVTFGVPDNNGQFAIIDRGLARNITDITGINPNLTSTYTALWNIAKVKDAKRSPNDIVAIHQSKAGRIAQRLITYAPTATKIFGTASFRCAVIVSIGHGENEDYCFDLYKTLNLNDVDKLPPVGAAAVKMVLRDNWLGLRRPVASIFALGMYCCGSVNQYKRRVSISAGMRTEYIALANEFLESCLKDSR